MRAFIAIELPAEIKNSLGAIQEKLKAACAGVKWVAPKNIHLTLKFLGEINAQQLEGIARILEDIGGENNVFSISFSSLGVFPESNYPRVIWVGVKNGESETKHIAQALEDKIAGIGIPKEKRPFSSHITLGRVKSSLNREALLKTLSRINSKDEFPEEEFSVTKITLFKSTLTPAGPVYEAIKEVNLKIK